MPPKRSKTSKSRDTKDELLEIADQMLDMMDKEINLEHIKKIYDLSKTFETNNSLASNKL